MPTLFRGPSRNSLVGALILFVVLFGLSAIAFAGATFGTTTGPTWNGTNWVLTTNVTTLTPPQQNICLKYVVANGPDAGTKYATCSPGNATGSNTCTIPGTEVQSTTQSIAWTLIATSATNCNAPETSNPISGPSGTFATNGTGPNAVTLSRFAANRAAASNWSLMAVVVIGLLGLGAGLWWARKRGQAYVG